MILTIPYPNIDPVFLRLGPVQLRWYGLKYMLSFIIGFFVLRRYAKHRKLNMSTDDLYDLLFYLILGVMIGGRLGYVLFYDIASYIREPLSIFAIWQGGMSFHGGFLGMILAAWYITRKKGWNFWTLPTWSPRQLRSALGLDESATSSTVNCTAGQRMWRGLWCFLKVETCRAIHPSSTKRC